MVDADENTQNKREPSRIVKKNDTFLPPIIINKRSHNFSYFILKPTRRALEFRSKVQNIKKKLCMKV